MKMTLVKRPLATALRGGLPRMPMASGMAFARPRLAMGEGILPDVKVDVDLGALPLSLGLFAAGGASFVLGGFMPSELQPVTTIAGIGLGIAGIVNLFKKSQERPGEEGQPGTAHQPGPEFSPSSASDFDRLSGEIASPKEHDEVQASGVFLNPSYTVRAVFRNDSSNEIEFLAELRIREQLYNIVGFAWPPYNTPGESRSYTQSQFIRISAGKDRVWDFVLRPAQGLRAAYLEVDVELVKKRETGDSGVVLGRRFFVVR